MKTASQTITNKLLLALCLAGVCASPALQAQNLAPDELDQAVRYLEKTRAGVLEATRGLSEAQWNFKQATNRWSIAEVTEHIAAAEDLLMGMVRFQAMQAPARTQPEDVKALDKLVLERVTDRTHKVQAPEPLVPNQRFGSPEGSLKHFQESRAKTIEFVKTTKGLRQHAYNLPQITWLNGKSLDAYEWVLYIAAHSERHTKQIEEVKTAPNFPKQ
jgi:hypothetical protein